METAKESKSKTIIQKLIRIQQKLKVPKNQINKFGGFNYRSCEDIQEALKPLLAKEGLFLRLVDILQKKGERYYIKSVAVVLDSEGNSVKTPGWARESKIKKGMDDAQITGSASSYARKYALGGMFLIDDTRDSDATGGQKGANTEKVSAKDSIDYLSKVINLLKARGCKTQREMLEKIKKDTGMIWNDLQQSQHKAMLVYKKLIDLPF